MPGHQASESTAALLLLTSAKAHFAGFNYSGGRKSVKRQLSGVLHRGLLWCKHFICPHRLLILILLLWPNLYCMTHTSRHQVCYFLRRQLFHSLRLLWTPQLPPSPLHFLLFSKMLICALERLFFSSITRLIKVWLLPMPRWILNTSNELNRRALPNLALI